MGNEFGAVEALWSQFEGVMGVKTGGGEEREGEGKGEKEREKEEEEE